jgi:hypothetical protein
MRQPLIACAGRVPLVLGAGAAAATPASAGTTDALLGTSLSCTLVNGVCVLFDAQLGQPHEAPLPASNEDGGALIVTGTVPPGTRVPCPVRSHAHHPRADARAAGRVGGNPKRALAAWARRAGCQARQPRKVNSIHVTGLAAGSPRSSRQAAQERTRSWQSQRFTNG